jgi:hypothetical protein
VLLKVLSVSDIPSRLFEQYRRQGEYSRRQCSGR